MDGKEQERYMTAVDYTWSSTNMDIIFPIVCNI